MLPWSLVMRLLSIEVDESGLMWLVPVILLVDVVIAIVVIAVVVAFANSVTGPIVDYVASMTVAGCAVG